ncbi:MAG TPA: NAD(P)H-quinone oxidoreductase, partial [Longimicrobiales bacterium]|nr:NAD(P)H-quinone oxidoreductase [Longimicrobiales bacterium]
PLPQPGYGYVRVAVRAVGVNRADVLQRLGRYPAPMGAPRDVPGLEFAGEVAAIGLGVTAWRPGDRVMGIVGGGAYAEAVVVHERVLAPVPDGMELEEAAAIPEAFITAHDGLFSRLGVGPGERVLVHGAGSGVGTAAIQLAAAAGATVFGTARSAWKLERAAAIGLAPERAIDASATDWVRAVRERTGGDGVDAILDLVGGEYLEGDVRVAADRGRILIVGLVAGSSATLDLGRVLRRRLWIGGTVLRSRPLEEKIEAVQAFRRHVLPLLSDGRVRPVIDRVVPMTEVAEAHRAIERNEPFGKIVLRW